MKQCKDIVKCFILILIALIFPCLSMQGEVRHWNKGRGFRPFKYSAQDRIEIDNETDTLQYSWYKLNLPTEQFSLAFRSKNLHSSPSKRYSYKNGRGEVKSISDPFWGFYITGMRDTIVVTIKGSEEFKQFESSGCSEITLYDLGRKEKRVTKVKELNPYQGENIWNIEVNNGVIEISGGDRTIAPILTYGGLRQVTGFGFIAGWGDRVRISDISLKTTEPEEQMDSGKNLYDLIGEISGNEDEFVGYWTIYDRDLDESLLKLGGEYILICTKDDEAYKFYYVEGGKVNSRNWQGGDLKAVLKPTSFPGLFDVEWIDSMKQVMKREIRAQKGDGNTLLIQFPYQSSSLRLRRLPNP